MLNKKSYLTSRAILGLANSLFSMAFIWWLQVITKRSSIVGVTEAIFSLTAFLSVFYGPIIDRYSFKKTSINSVIIQTVFLFITTGSVYFFSKNFWIAIIFGGVVSICDEFFSPADRAILKKSTADKRDLNDMISKISIIDQFIGVAGTALSGILLGFMLAGQIMLFCSLLSFLGVALLIFALKKVLSEKPKVSEKNSNYVKQILSGYKFISTNYFLNRYLWSSILYSFTTPAMAVFLPKLAQQFGRATLYSVFYICFMLGFIVGALIAGRLKVEINIIGISWIISAVPLFVMIFFISNWMMLSVLIFAFGMITSIHNILSESMTQNVSNDEILGRVLTTIRTSTSIGGPIGSIAAGLLLDHSNESILIFMCSLLILIGGINILFSKR